MDGPSSVDDVTDSRAPHARVDVAVGGLALQQQSESAPVMSGSLGVLGLGVDFSWPWLLLALPLSISPCRLRPRYFTTSEASSQRFVVDQVPSSGSSRLACSGSPSSVRFIESHKTGSRTLAMSNSRRKKSIEDEIGVREESRGGM